MILNDHMPEYVSDFYIWVTDNRLRSSSQNQL